MTHIATCMPAQWPVACHTDHVGPGSTFVAIQGMKSNGIDHIPAALNKGATTIVIAADAVLPNDSIQAVQEAGAQLIRVENTRLALAQLSAHAAGHPARKLKLIAITGTKGKTTSSFLLAHVLESAGYHVALLSTVGNSIQGVSLPASLTTAQPDYLHQFFKLCVERNVTHVVMEVAAQAVSLHRVHGLVYDALLFTNFSQEHGEFYTNMADYFAAKTALFDQRSTQAPALINGDDPACSSLLARYNNCFAMHMQTPTNHTEQASTCSPAIRVPAIVGNFVNTSTGCVQGTVTCHGIEYPISCPALVGEFNAYNSMGVVGIAHFFGLMPAHVRHAFSTFAGVPGRLARYQLPNGASCYIDYAHNPSSYDAVLGTLSRLTDHLIVIFGAGGERDKAKRPVMGAIAAHHASIIIVTSDNPRTEQPEQIIEDICAGIPASNQCTIIRELDREKAIKIAYNLSQSGSILAILGKGTDEYQIVGTTKTFFSEAAIVQAL